MSREVGFQSNCNERNRSCAMPTVDVTMCRCDNASCRLMVASGVRRGRAQRESPGQAELLDEFAAACTRISFRPPLTVAESVFLQNLQSER